MKWFLNFWDWSERNSYLVTPFHLCCLIPVTILYLVLCSFSKQSFYIIFGCWVAWGIPMFFVFFEYIIKKLKGH